MPQHQVRVRAEIVSAVEGVQVFFRAVDVDDPSANRPPVDDEGQGQDNRGTPPDGAFIQNGQPVGNETSAVTVVTGGVAAAEVVLQVTMQPGDNFRVVAS